MRKAFDEPRGSADFRKIADPKATGEPPLAIDAVFHKTFLELDEKGTEAAAATAISFAPTAAAPDPDKPVEVRVDRPFLFAVQHLPSGTCLFLGRVTDPR
jgi:serpin B